jgi:hypothetical protein
VISRHKVTQPHHGAQPHITPTARASARSRTAGLRITNAALCQLIYRGIHLLNRLSRRLWQEIYSPNGEQMLDGNGTTGRHRSAGKIKRVHTGVPALVHIGSTASFTVCIPTTTSSPLPELESNQRAPVPETGRDAINPSGIVAGPAEGNSRKRNRPGKFFDVRHLGLEPRPYRLRADYSAIELAARVDLFHRFHRS